MYTEEETLDDLLHELLPSVLEHKIQFLILKVIMLDYLMYSIS